MRTCLALWRRGRQVAGILSKLTSKVPPCLCARTLRSCRNMAFSWRSEFALLSGRCGTRSPARPLQLCRPCTRRRLCPCLKRHTRTAPQLAGCPSRQPPGRAWVAAHTMVLQGKAGRAGALVGMQRPLFALSRQLWTVPQALQCRGAGQCLLGSRLLLLGTVAAAAHRLDGDLGMSQSTDGMRCTLGTAAGTQGHRQALDAIGLDTSIGRP